MPSHAVFLPVPNQLLLMVNLWLEKMGMQLHLFAHTCFANVKRASDMFWQTSM